MDLINRNAFPPHGFPYFEPKLNWHAPDPKLPYYTIVGQIQAVRAANPGSGLDPTWEACDMALAQQTCKRLKNDPSWCIDLASPVAKAQAAAKTAKRVGGCGGCGARRSRRARA